ncbi:MAG: hypothetical protein ACKN9T_18275 [Candidatus Methylumidiphilus sp.]
MEEPRTKNQEPSAQPETQDLVTQVIEDEIRHGFAEPLTEAGEGYEWAWVQQQSSYKGWWVAVKVGCTPFTVMGFSLVEVQKRWLDRWIEIETKLLGHTVVQVGEWWVAVKCDG